MINANNSAFPTSYIGDDAPHEGIGGGLTKREYFAIHSSGMVITVSDPKYIASCLGWPAPEILDTDNIVWSAWWRRAEAAWKVSQADALMAALAGDRDRKSVV